MLQIYVMNTSHLLPFVHLFVAGPFSPVCVLVVFLWLLALLLGAECELYVCCVSFYSACPMHTLPTHLLTRGLFCCICTIPHLGGWERGAIFASIWNSAWRHDDEEAGTQDSSAPTILSQLFSPKKPQQRKTLSFKGRQIPFRTASQKRG